MFQPTQYGDPKALCVVPSASRVIQKILFPRDVALPAGYPNDVRFDLRRGAAGMAFITGPAQQAANGIVVDLGGGEGLRRLTINPPTRAEPIASYLPTVEGRPFDEHHPMGRWPPGRRWDRTASPSARTAPASPPAGSAATDSTASRSTP